MPTYRFRPVEPNDRDLLTSWVSEPHVAAWWDDVPDADAPEDPHVARWIVEADGRAFAFMQDYDVHAWADHHFGDLPAGSRGLDQFIGDPAMVGHGHGPAFIARRMDMLFALGAPVLAVDPHPDNARAIAAYRKVGFRIVGASRESAWGPFLPMHAAR